MVTKLKADQLTIKMKECLDNLKKYSRQIKRIEADSETPNNEKILQMKKIMEELSKVGTEIDSIKKEIKIIKTYSLN